MAIWVAFRCWNLVSVTWRLFVDDVLAGVSPHVVEPVPHLWVVGFSEEALRLRIVTRKVGVYRR